MAGRSLKIFLTLLPLQNVLYTSKQYYLLLLKIYLPLSHPEEKNLK